MGRWVFGHCGISPSGWQMVTGSLLSLLRVLGFRSSARVTAIVTGTVSVSTRERRTKIISVVVAVIVSVSTGAFGVGC